MATLPTSRKYGKIPSEPVLVFDNKLSDSLSEIGLLTILDVAELLKVSVTGVRRLQQKRDIPFIKVGGSIRFSRNDIQSYLIAQRVEPIGK